MWEDFKTRAEAVGAEVYRFASQTEALEFILTFLVQEGVANRPGAYALWADSPLIQGIECRALEEKLPGLKFTCNKELAAQARIGISQMDWGLADTGTLVQVATQVEQRLVSTLPEIHLAILGTRQILPDMGALLPRVKPAETSYLAFITGPSRTADIERVLTIGVHGPGRLVIVLVDDLGGGN